MIAFVDNTTRNAQLLLATNTMKGSNTDLLLLFSVESSAKAAHRYLGIT